MFEPPPRASTTVFARLPDALRRADQPSAWAAGQPIRRAAHSLLEGPCITPQGRFFCVDVAHGRIFEIVDGDFRVAADYDGEPNGLRARHDGRLFVADYRRGVLEFDPATGSVTPVIERFRAEGFLGVNDLAFAPNGDLYFTDQGLTGLHDPAGRVFRWTTDARLELLLDNIPSPNGLVVNDAGTELYVGVTRDNAIWRVPLMADGGVAKVGRFIQMSGGVGPDGLAMDAEGNLFVAHVGLGCVWVFNPRGEPQLRIDSCAGAETTNIVFGGEANKTLFITEAEDGVILTAPLSTSGRNIFHAV